MPNIDWKALSPSQRAEELRKYLNNVPVPRLDWTEIPPAVPEMKIDVPQRVEELHKYLRDNTYPAQTKNIMAAIEMYNRKELPKPGTNVVHIHDGKLIELKVECLLTPVWTEVCLRQLARIYLIHALGPLSPVHAVVMMTVLRFSYAKWLCQLGRD
jgi:hypothetical protein